MAGGGDHRGAGQQKDKKKPPQNNPPKEPKSDPHDKPWENDPRRGGWGQQVLVIGGTLALAGVTLLVFRNPSAAGAVGAFALANTVVGRNL